MTDQVKNSAATSPTILPILCDVAALGDLAEIGNQVASALVDAPQFPPEILDEFVGFCQSPEEFIVLEQDDLPAGDAGELLVRLEPTDRLRRLLATLGARDGD